MGFSLDYSMLDKFLEIAYLISRGNQSKLTEFDWELFDLYQEKDLSLKEAAAAIPKNVLPSDFWVHRKYAHNLSSRYENNKANFTR